MMCLGASAWAENYATWTFASGTAGTNFPSNNTAFTATSGSCGESSYKMNGSGSTWNSSKGYAFTAVTDMTVTLKLTGNLDAGSSVVFAADMYYNKASNAPMTGFNLSISEKNGSYVTTGLSATSLSLSTSSENKSVTYTTQTALKSGDEITLKYTQTGKAGVGQGYVGNITVDGPELTSGPATPYTVNFNAGTNGTCANSSLIEASAGAGVTLPNVTANTGWTFKGWSTSATPTSANAGVAGDTYKPSSDCTLYAYYTVARPAGEVFYESFNTNDGTGGNDDKWSGSIASNTFNSDNTWQTASASGANQCAKFGTGSKLGQAITPAIAASGNFILTFKAAAWDGSSESTILNLTATNATLSTSTVTMQKGAWDTFNVNITNAREGFTIRFEGNQASNSRFFLDEVSIVEAPATATITLNAACHDTEGNVYGTYSNESAWIVADDIEVSEISIVDGQLYVESYNTGDIVPANTGVMVSAAEGGNYEVVLSNEEGTSVLGNDNFLHPSSEAMTGNNLFYRLTMHNGTQIGFAWGAENGAAFSLAANKAYLAVPAGAGVKSLMWFGETETAIQSIEAENNSKVIYDLQGRRVNKAQKGLYIVNGKKVLF